MKKRIKLFGVIVFMAIIGVSLIGCEWLYDDPNGTGGSGTGGSGGAGSTRNSAILVTVGHSSSRTISSSGEHWFRFVGTGNPVIFETRGSVVATSLTRAIGTGSLETWNINTSGGQGDNALLSTTPAEGVDFFIRVTTRNSTSGTYTFVVTAPTTNLRANPITVSVGNSSSHIINSSGQHWFRFTGNGNRVFFETDGGVVNTSITSFIGDSTSNFFTGNNGINFITTLGTIYNIRITGNAGTYTFNVRHGTGDGSSRYLAREVSRGNLSSHTITANGEHWFIFQGDGNPVVFETSGNIVATALTRATGTGSLETWNINTSGGQGDNARISTTVASGVNFFVRVTARNSTFGTYTFIVE